MSIYAVPGTNKWIESDEKPDDGVMYIVMPTPPPSAGHYAMDGEWMTTDQFVG